MNEFSVGLFHQESSEQLPSSGVDQNYQTAFGGTMDNTIIDERSTVLELFQNDVRLYWINIRQPIYKNTSY